MAIIKCPECGHQINETATVCPICGEKIAGNIVKCNFCGEVYFKDDGICPRCYRSLPQGEDDTDETVSSEDSSVDNTNGSSEGSANPPVDLNEVVGESEKVVVSEQTEEKGDDADTDKVDAQVQKEVEEEDEDEIAQQQPVDKDNDNSESVAESDDAEEEAYIDTDDENLEKPVHEDDGKVEEDKGKHKYIPVVVSLAIAALIAAVSLYFYNASKLDDETRAYDIAMESNDVREMQNFLRNFPNATSKHKQEVQDKIEHINKHKDDLSVIMLTRDKEKIMQFLNNYPETPKKQTLLAMVDSIDWEDAQKQNTKDAYEHYLEAHAAGLFAQEAKDRIAVKIVAANAEDEARAKSLFREFFLSVNGNESSRLMATLSPQMTSFIGTNNPSNGDVVAWMNRQHKDDVSHVIWKLNHDYKITKREQNNVRESTVDFTAKQTLNYKDGRTSSEHYKVTATVTDNNKISSMSMTKYVPKPGEQSASSSSSGSPSAGNGKPSVGNSSPKPSGTSSSPKPSGTSSSPKPTGTSNASKPSGTSNASKSSGSSNASKPSGSGNASKPSGSGNASKPSGSGNASKPSGSGNASKPSGSSNANKPSGSSNASKPSGSGNASKPSGSGNASKPSGSSNASKPSNGTNKQNTGSKPSSAKKRLKQVLGKIILRNPRKRQFQYYDY